MFTETQRPPPDEAGIHSVGLDHPPAPIGVTEPPHDGEAGSASDIGSLAPLFRTIEEIEAGGAPKFAPATCRHLARLIAARAYAKRLTEFCHLVCAAACYDPRNRYEHFFWATGPARPSAFKSYFLEARRRSPFSPPLSTVGADGIELDYGGDIHTIAFSRMPLLAAIAEFLLTALGYTQVDEHLAPLLAEDVRRRDVEEAANGLARLVHAYLAPRLPSAQNLTKFRAMTRFLEAHGTSGAAAESIDDGAILDFWLAHSALPEAEAMGFRTYRSAFRAFVRLHGALIEARENYNLDHPRALGPEAEAGEVDPERISRALETLNAPADPLAVLGDPLCTGIKCFNRQESHELEDLLFCGRLARPLAHSVLRDGVFGDGQSRLGRMRAADRGRDRIKSSIAKAVTGNYLERIGRHRDLAAHGRRVLLAAFHVLARMHNAEAVTVLTALAPGLDLSAFGDAMTDTATPEKGTDRHATVVRLPNASPLERFLKALQSRPEDLGGDVARLAAEGRAAYRSLSRQGFREKDLERDEVASGFAAAAGPLVQIDEFLQSFAAALAQSPSDWEKNFAADSEKFLPQFHLIYGERHDEAAQ